MTHRPVLSKIHPLHGLQIKVDRHEEGECNWKDKKRQMSHVDPSTSQLVFESFAYPPPECWPWERMQWGHSEWHPGLWNLRDWGRNLANSSRFKFPEVENECWVPQSGFCYATLVWQELCQYTYFWAIHPTFLQYLQDLQDT